MLRTIFCTSLVVLAGCSSLQQEEYTFAGGDFSEVTFETDAPNWSVDTYISTSEVDCEGFRSSGKLFYDAQLRGGGFFGALQQLNPIRPDENLSVTHRVPANSVLQVKATATTSGSGRYGRCGPVAAKFNTGDNDKFKVYIGLKNGYCSLTVTDLAGNTRAREPMRCK